MAYATVDDVKRLNKYREYTATSEVSYSDVESYLDWIAAEIDSKLSRAGYNVPITGTEALKILKLVNALGAAAMAEDAQFMGTQDPGQSRHGEILWQQYHERLNKIVNGEIYLRDASLTNELEKRPAGKALWSFTEQYDDTPEPEADLQPVFRWEEDQW